MVTDKDLVNKTCIVTGAAGGLGKAIAMACLEAGGNVVVCDVNEKMLAECAAELAPRGELLTVRADVTDDASMTTVFKQAVDKFGQVDILINNAGIMDKFEGVANIERATWDLVMAINLTGPMITTKQMLNHLSARSSGGAIINIGSMASVRGGAAGAAYTASKHGLVGLTKSTAAYYNKQGVRCNIIMPGVMETNIATAFANGMDAKGYEIACKVMAVGPAKCELDQIAKLCVFLGSDSGVVVNGATISADGGWNAY